MGEAALSAQNVTMRFGDFTALEAVSVSVRKGSITGLIGPNGAGKTTLFNILAGMLRPSEGSVSVGADDVTRLSPDQRFAKGLGRTFQIPRPFARMSVLENVMLAPMAQTGERLAGASQVRILIHPIEASESDMSGAAYLTGNEN